MAPDPQPRADARRNRDAVVDAGIRVLGENPDASMREIADASGLTRTTVYRHFPARDELVRAILERVRDHFVALAEQTLAREEPAVQLLRRLAAAFVADSAGYGFLTGFRELAEEVFDAGEIPRQDPVHAWLAAARTRGEVRADVPLDWQFHMTRALITAAAQEVAGGRIEADEAGRLLGASLVALLTP